MTVPAGYWLFGRLSADGSTFTGVQSGAVAAMDTTVQLTGMFDAHSGKIVLRVGGEQNGDWQQYTSQSGTGEIAVGAQMSGATYNHYLAAKVSDVRIWAGAMNDERQISELIGS
ncbi:hypothetical protein [Streptomyces sp. NPDC057413]|uniref:hypothetical protein n=1 Tax=Streptomyces sp. NPDC057413 TaxID=3346124 RepID=UPI00367681B8